jgi:hypothetical protein
MSVRRKRVVAGVTVAIAVAILIALNIFQQPPMTFTAKGDTLVVNGTTGSNSLVDLEEALAVNPKTRVLVLNRIEGSDDDAINLVMAQTIRNRNLDTHLNAGSVIESGGIELFIGGFHRTMEEGAHIGVHSWYDEEGRYEGRALPRDHPDHRPYLETYHALGVPEALYWFILSAAGSDGMYFMTDEEIKRFDLVTSPIGEGPHMN